MINRVIKKVLELIWSLNICSNFRIINVHKMHSLNKSFLKRKIIINQHNKYQIFIKEQIHKIIKIN